MSGETGIALILRLPDEPMEISQWDYFRIRAMFPKSGESQSARHDFFVGGTCIEAVRYYVDTQYKRSKDEFDFRVTQEAPDWVVYL